MIWFRLLCVCTHMTSCIPSASTTPKLGRCHPIYRGMAVLNIGNKNPVESGSEEMLVRSLCLSVFDYFGPLSLC